MNKFVLSVLTILPLAIASGQDARSTPASSGDIESLRHQVQSLAETVKALQQTVKDQQVTIERMNQETGQVSQNPEPSPIAAAASPSPSTGGREAASFPTEDTSVVSSTTAAAAASPGPGVNANGAALSGTSPTTDTSV